MQHVYDAIKKARVDGEAWVTIDGHRSKVIPVDPESLIGDRDFYALVRAKVPGGVQVQYLRSGRTVTDRLVTPYPQRYLGWDDVLAVLLHAGA